MSKPAAAPKTQVLDLSSFCKTSFTLTFVIEVIGIDVWHDCNEGWLDLGPIAQGLRLQYHLYPGQAFDIDIAIWPHAAKVCCGQNYDWVRTWQFLERRWLTFSIRHAFPLRVNELRNFVATVVPHAGIGSLGATCKSDMPTNEVYLPPLMFGKRRQFSPIIEFETPLWKYVEEMIWQRIVHFIPASYLDGPFDTPYPVSDVRHQDAALYQVQDVILNGHVVVEVESEPEAHNKGRRQSKEKEKKKVLEVHKVKYEIKLSGDSIISGIGRVVPFDVIGDRPLDLGEVIVLISSTNLPAQDDLPVFFVNVGTLTDIPMEHFKQHGFTHIYTRWTISEEEHSSELHSLVTKQSKREVNFNDHHSVPMSSILAYDIMAIFLEDPFEIELRGIRTPPPLIKMPKFFGYEKGDRDFGIAVPPPLPNQDTDILIAKTRIDARLLSKMNGFVKGEFPLYPPKPHVEIMDREGICTNDINAVRAKIKPYLVIQPGVILEAQMTIEVSMGIVGCKPQPLLQRFSRLYCLVSQPEAIMSLLRQITEINESVLLSGSRNGLLTGFGLDTGDAVMLYVEGPKEGQILRVWERAEDFHPNVKPVFSSSAKYQCRLYPELLLAAMPFNILKMFVPLTVILSMAPIYARPALPLLTRAAVLKIGRLVASKITSPPCRQDMPSVVELKSFKLELCVAPRPPPVTASDIKQSFSEQGRSSLHSVSRINWEKQSKQIPELPPIFVKKNK